MMVDRVKLVPKSAPRIPENVLSLFGDPPVLSTENPNVYSALLHEVATVTKPRNIIEWMWVNDLVYLSWSIRRLRRFQALVIEEQRNSLTYSAARKKEERLREYGVITLPEERYPKNVLNTERGSAIAFNHSISSYEAIDKLIDSAERRRSIVLRDIQFYREGLAHLLEEASNKIIEGECQEAAA